MSFPDKCKAIVLESRDESLDGLKLKEVPLPKELEPDQIVVRIHAVSLNARDLQVATNTYPAPPGAIRPASQEIIPCSDGAGEVVATGARVQRVKKGDRVATQLAQGWLEGEGTTWLMQSTGLGAAGDGTLTEYIVLSQEGVVKIPDFLSYEDAATLPCAPLTAFHCLFGPERSLKQGQNVLIEGTGGVSIAALKFSLFAGARPIVISSSDDKLNRVHQLGVTDTINYKKVPEWSEPVVKITDGVGIHHGIEIGGRDTMPKALSTLTDHGNLWVVGYLDDYKKEHRTPAESPDLAKMCLLRQCHVKGVYTGSRALFESMLGAYSESARRAKAAGKDPTKEHALKPSIDRVFPLDKSKEAFKLMGTGQFFGKIVIKVQ